MNVMSIWLVKSAVRWGRRCCWRRGENPRCPSLSLSLSLSLRGRTRAWLDLVYVPFPLLYRPHPFLLRLPVVIISRRTAGMTGTFHSICKHAGPVCPSSPLPLYATPQLTLESKGNAFCGRFPQCAILKQRKLQFQLKCLCVSEWVSASKCVCEWVYSFMCVCVCNRKWATNRRKW